LVTSASITAAIEDPTVGVALRTCTNLDEADLAAIRSISLKCYSTREKWRITI